MKERHSPVQSWIPPTPLLAVLNFKRDDVSYAERIITSLLKTSRSTHLPALPSCCASAGGRKVAGQAPLPPDPHPREKRGHSHSRAVAPQLGDRHASHPRPQQGGDKVWASYSQGAVTLPPSSSLPSEKRCETNTDYPCCSTLRIEA